MNNLISNAAPYISMFIIGSVVIYNVGGYLLSSKKQEKKKYYGGEDDEQLFI